MDWIDILPDLPAEAAPLPRPRKDATIVSVSLDADDVAMLDKLAEAACMTRSAVALASVRAGLAAFSKRPEAIAHYLPAGFRPRRPLRRRAA